MPKTLWFENAETLRFEIAPPQNRSYFSCLKIWAPSTCLCCCTGKKHCDLEFAISKRSDLRFHSVIFLRNLWWELRIWICDLKTRHCDCDFWGHRFDEYSGRRLNIFVQMVILSLGSKVSAKKGSTPTPWAGGLRDQIQKWALQTQKTLYFQGFLCSEGDWDHGLRPWSRKGPDHGVGVDPETLKVGGRVGGQQIDAEMLMCFLGPFLLVSHYSTIGNTISCDAPYSAIGFGAKFFLRPPPPSKACLWIAIGHFCGKKWGCTSDSLRHHRNWEELNGGGS